MSNKKHKFVRLVLVGVCIILGFIFVWHYLREGENKNLRKQAAHNGITKNYSEDIYIYQSNDDMIRVDEADHTIYYSNLILAFLVPSVDEKVRDELASSIDGVLVGNIHSASDMIQIYVKATSLDALNELSSQLMEREEVLYAMHEIPIVIENSAESQKLSEEIIDAENNPDGENWWAESIGAYTAWELYEQYTNPVTVAVIDDGFDLKHENLKGKIRMMNENSLLELDGKSHGTMVTGLIAANEIPLRDKEENLPELRGILNQVEVLATDWESSSGNSILSTGEYLSYLSESIKQGARVVNMSFDHVSEYTYKRFGKNKSTSEEAAEEYAMNVSYETGVAALVTMMDLYLDGYTDYLLVQSAGNDATTAEYGAFFCGVNPLKFKGALAAMSEKNPKLSKLLKGVNYDYFRDRILIVGSVENSRKDSNYNLVSEYNFGKAIDIVAPGKDIYSLGTTGAMEGKGTSYSAPLVAGSAAFIWSMDFTMTPAEVKNYLLTSSDSLGIGTNPIDPREKYPMLNLGQAASRVYEDRIAESERGAEVEEVIDTDLQPESEKKLVMDAFAKVLKNVAVPEYGVISTETISVPIYSVDSKEHINGLLSANIMDFDHDEEDEMLVSRFVGTDNGPRVYLDMYEYDVDGKIAYLAASKSLGDSYAFSESEIGYRQLGIFTYTYDGDVYIAIDNNIIANEAVNNVAIYQYGGEGYIITSCDPSTGRLGKAKSEHKADEFYYVCNIAYDHYGVGYTAVYEAYSEEEPIAPLWCRGDHEDSDTGWHIIDELHDSYDFDVTPQQKRAIMDIYVNSLADIGLITDDPRIGTAEVSESYNLEYAENKTTTADIYTAVNGNVTYLCGIYTLREGRMDEYKPLIRKDYQHTLDAYRLAVEADHIISESSDRDNNLEANLEDDHIISGLSDRYITSEEVQRLTLQAINYAKNEIYAIHGRKFKSIELTDYFNSKSWYHGTIEAENFSDTVFNDYEKANLILLVNREQELAGADGYVLDQPGYDIKAVAR